MKFNRFYILILAFAANSAYATASNWIEPVTTAPTNPVLITDKVLFEAYQDLATQINSKGPSVEDDVSALDSRATSVETSVSALNSTVNGVGCSGGRCTTNGLVQNVAAVQSDTTTLKGKFANNGAGALLEANVPTLGMNKVTGLSDLNNTVNGVGCDANGGRCTTNGLVQNLGVTNNNLSNLTTTVNGSGNCNNIDNCANPSIVMNVMKLLKDAGVITTVTISNGVITGVQAQQQMVND